MKATISSYANKNINTEKKGKGRKRGWKNLFQTIHRNYSLIRHEINLAQKRWFTKILL